MKAVDMWGCEWEQVLTMYDKRLSRHEKDWWYWRYKPNQSAPDYVEL